MRSKRDVEKREQELETKLLELEQQAQANNITLDASQPPPALQRCSTRRTATPQDRKVKLAAFLMERIALLSLRQNSAAYDLVLGSRASQSLHMQANNSQRLEHIDRQVQRLESSLGLAESWTPNSPDFLAAKLEVIRVRSTPVPHSMQHHVMSAC